MTIETVQVLLPAKMIPSDTVVTKKTGKKPYTLRRTVKVFGHTGSVVSSFTTRDDTVILCRDGHANVISGETKLLVEMSEFQIQQLFNPPPEGE